MTPLTGSSPVLTRRPRTQECPHQPRCPDACAADRTGAKTLASFPDQGWSLLCNGVVVFDDGGALLPGGGAVGRPQYAIR
jgi:Family of unknown function (DUF5999)